VKDSFDFSALGTQGFIVKYPNTLLTVMKRKPFRVLLSRIGDSCWVELLTKYSMFVELPNGCYMQISGLPTGFLYERLKKGRLLERDFQQRKKRQKIEFLAEKEVNPKKRQKVHEGGSCTKRNISSSDCKIAPAKKCAVFQRSRMFYAPSSSEKFHQGCLISQLQASNNGARKLIQHALLDGPVLHVNIGDGQCLSKKPTRGKPNRLSKGMVKLIPLFKSFIANFRRVDIGQLLKRHCPLQKSLSSSDESRLRSKDIGELLSSCSSHYQESCIL
jgi:hypothetical protein